MSPPNPVVRSLTATLLHYMGQFMRQQLLPAGTERSILSRTKNYVVADCVGKGIHRLCGFCGPLVRVNAHFGEVIAESRLHVCTRLRVEGFTGQAQHFIHDNRD